MNAANRIPQKSNFLINPLCTGIHFLRRALFKSLTTEQGWTLQRFQKWIVVNPGGGDPWKRSIMRDFKSITGDVKEKWKKIPRSFDCFIKRINDLKRKKKREENKKKKKERKARERSSAERKKDGTKRTSQGLARRCCSNENETKLPWTNRSNEEDTILSGRKEGAAQLLSGQDSGISWEPR